MFKPNYDWIQDHIDNSDNSGRPLTAQAFEECLKLLKEKDEKIVVLQRELRKYKAPKRRKV